MSWSGDAFDEARVSAAAGRADAGGSWLLVLQAIVDAGILCRRAGR